MNKGFTLIEVIIVVCIILLLFVMVWPVGANFYRQEILSKADSQIIWLLKQARTNAIDQKNNSAFGVYLDNCHATLFQGPSYETRVADQDAVYDLPSLVTISGLKQIVFAPNTGFASSNGTINLSAPPFSREIKINGVGVIDY